MSGADVARGHLILIGGAAAERPNMAILERFVDLAGGEGNARVAIVSTASERGIKAAEKYVNAFELLDVARIEILDIRTRSEANHDDVIRKLEECDGIFFTGGDQSRIVTVFRETGFLRRLQRLHFEEGLPVAGSSAGAVAAGNPMILDGKPGDAFIYDGIGIGDGLGIVNDCIFDSHVVKRQRLVRLIQAVARHPGAAGIGIAEDTAIHVYPALNVEVLGTGPVILVTGDSIECTNMGSLKKGELISLRGLTVNLFIPGSRFDLEQRPVPRK